MSFFKKPRSNWLQENTKELSYIQNKPALKPVATSGSYNDLKNKLTAKTDGGITIDDKNEISLASEAQIPVQSNWLQENTKELSYIQNKPELSAVAESGTYNHLKNTLKPAKNSGITIDGNNEISYTPPDKSQNFNFTILKDGFGAFRMRPRCDFAIAKIGNYAIFAGGQNREGSTSTVDVYKLTGGKLEKDTSTDLSLSEARYSLAATTVGNYAIFAGGYNSEGPTSTVDVYKLTGEGKLVKYESAGLSLSKAHYSLAATTVGNYVIFAGGVNNEGPTRTVDVYKVDDEGELVKYESAGLSLSEARTSLSATTVGNYAIFAGGVNNEGPTRTVDVYYLNGDTLVEDTSAGLSLSEARGSLAATTVGNYAIFAGGQNNEGHASTVDVYYLNGDTLVKYESTDLSLSEARYSLAATTVGNYAIFAGGNTGGAYITTVDVYKLTGGKLEKDTSTDLSLSEARYSLAATTVGNYAIFAGGWGGGGPTSTVDVYKLTGEGKLVKYENTDLSLSEARSDLAATTVGNYAIFAGGWGGGGPTSTVDVYKLTDGKLEKDTSAGLSLSKAPRYLAATTVENYAIFAGGQNNEGHASTVDVYKLTGEGELVKYESTDLSLSEARSDLAATTVGNYVIFAGGYNSEGPTSTVDVYKLTGEGKLVKYESAGLSLSKARYCLSATTVGNYAIFAGGHGGDQLLNTVDVYKVTDGKLVKYESAGLSLSEARSHLAATTVGNYVIFAGGHGGDQLLNTVDVYKVTDGKLEKDTSTVSPLSVPRGNLSATTVGNYAIFAGGFQGIYLNTVDVYKFTDGKLEKDTSTGLSLSEARCSLAATTVGNYVIFAGGENGNINCFNTVDVYKKVDDAALTKECGRLQEIKVYGIAAEETGICDVLLSKASDENDKKEEEEWRKINKIHTTDGSVVVECFDETPEVDLNVVMKV